MSSATATSRVVVAAAFGGPEVLQLVDVEVPVPGEGEVLIDVRAVGINPYDTKVYNGGPGADPARLPLRLGLEVSGVVAEVGAGVSQIEVGDEVIAYPVSGAYAEKIVTAADNVFAKPAQLTFEQAAGLLLTAVTAVKLLDATRVSAGDTVLLHGGAGGVGLIAVQLIVARGARVIATASPGRHAYLRELGAEPVAYGDGLAERVRAIAPEGVDAALDTVGTDEAVDVSIELVADRSRIATIAAFARAKAEGITLLTESELSARAQVLDAVARGELTVKVDRAFALADVRAAHEYVADGHAHGKVVLVP